MMLGKKMHELMLSQIQAEMYSAQLYLAMSAYCESENLKGFANWLRVQYQEETAHALKFVDHILERGAEVELKAFDAPPAKFGTPLKLFEEVLGHEKKITGMISKLYETAVAEKDYASQIFLQWFVTEQVEEEANANEIVGKLKMIGDKSAGAVLYLDKELKKRGSE